MRKISSYSFLFVLAITASAFLISDSDEVKDAQNLDLFTSVFKNLKNEFVDTLNSDILIRRAIDGMVKSVDPYTVFFDEKESKERVNTWKGTSYAGIGALVISRDSNIIITNPVEGYGAQQNDLRAGDVYVEAEGQPLKGKSLDAALKIIRGVPESITDIVVNRPYVGLVKKTITRKQIYVNTIPYYGMLDSVTGYIQVQQFLVGTANQFTETVKALKKNTQLKFIILDFRDNIGGLVEEAVNCLNVFVPKNTVVCRIKGKVPNYENITLYEPLDTLLPLVILTNNNTVSSGEIFTAAMQDLDRAVVIGQKTFGKGFVQGTRFPGQGTSLYVTAGRYYTPSGRCIQKLDYSHKYSDGKVTAFADSLKQSFFTRNGRKVFNIGGIEPDIKTEPAQKPAPVIESLNSASLIFDYATYFRNTKEIKASAREFKITDADFFDFIRFVEKKKYAFSLAEEEKLKEFEAIAQKNNSLQLFEKKYKSLYQQIIVSKKEMLLQNKEKIKKALQDEIVKRYYYYTGYMQNALPADLEVEKAKEILKDQKLYFDILNKR